MKQQELRFRGGRFGASVPLLFFVAWAITICVYGAPDENGLILGAVIGIVIGMFLPGKFVFRQKGSAAFYHTLSLLRFDREPWRKQPSHLAPTAAARSLIGGLALLTRPIDAHDLPVTETRARDRSPGEPAVGS